MLGSDQVARVTDRLRSARKRGLVLVTARVTPGAMLRGASTGIFPYPLSDVPWLVPWYSPPERAVLRAETVHLGKMMRRCLNRQAWLTSVNQAFDEVVRRCADRRVVWITPQLRETFAELHRRGHAYSVEVWNDRGDLIGGTFGVQAGAMFGSESMFHTERDSSKVAMVDLASRIRAAGGLGIDCQYPNEHLGALGAEVLDRRAFRALLRSGLGVTPRLSTEKLPAARLVDPLSPDAVGVPSRRNDTLRCTEQ